MREYNCLVRVKTSITLPKQLLLRLDRVDRNRSAVLERAAEAYLAELDRQARDQRDLEIINRHSKRLNREAMDALEYQRLS
jgi:metal-responsive CopG/Arc/MetJ family transcriptional regulator